MFVRNKSNTYLSLSYNGGVSHRQIPPQATVTLVDADETDVVIRTQVKLGVLEIVDAPAESKANKPELPTIKVAGETKTIQVVKNDESKDVMTTVKCPAVKKNGEVCGQIVQLKEGETNDEVHFCGVHKCSAKAEDYHQVESGAWVFGKAEEPAAASKVATIAVDPKDTFKPMQPGDVKVPVFEAE